MDHLSAKSSGTANEIKILEMQACFQGGKEKLMFARCLCNSAWNREVRVGIYEFKKSSIMSSLNNADNSQIGSMIKCSGTNSNFQQTRSRRSLDWVIVAQQQAAATVSRWLFFTTPCWWSVNSSSSHDSRSKLVSLACDTMRRHGNIVIKSAMPEKF